MKINALTDDKTVYACVKYFRSSKIYWLDRTPRARQIPRRGSLGTVRPVGEWLLRASRRGRSVTGPGRPASSIPPPRVDTLTSRVWTVIGWNRRCCPVCMFALLHTLQAVHGQLSGEAAGSLHGCSAFECSIRASIHEKSYEDRVQFLFLFEFSVASQWLHVLFPKFSISWNWRCCMIISMTSQNLLLIFGWHYC